MNLVVNNTKNQKRRKKNAFNRDEIVVVVKHIEGKHEFANESYCD